MDEWEELDLLASNLIPLLGLFQGFCKVLGTFMQTVFEFSCDSSLSDMVWFSWLRECRVNCLAIYFMFEIT